MSAVTSRFKRRDIHTSSCVPLYNLFHTLAHQCVTWLLLQLRKIQKRSLLKQKMVKNNERCKMSRVRFQWQVLERMNHSHACLSGMGKLSPRKPQGKRLGRCWCGDLWSSGTKSTFFLLRNGSPQKIIRKIIFGTAFFNNGINRETTCGHPEDQNFTTYNILSHILNEKLCNRLLFPPVKENRWTAKWQKKRRRRRSSRRREKASR